MRLLLHMCCGPCACYPVRKLRADGVEPVGYFFNPNIHPYREWDTRRKTAAEFAEKIGMEFYADDAFRLRDFLRRALAAEDGVPFDEAADGGADAVRYAADLAARRRARCRMCYAWRLEQTARFAAENGFTAFSSTLFYSVYQDHALMKEIAARAADAYGAAFYYEDFRSGWQIGIDISREMGLYRQSYCGCVFSEEERYSRALRKARKKAGRAQKAKRLAAAAEP